MTDLGHMRALDTLWYGDDVIQVTVKVRGQTAKAVITDVIVKVIVILIVVVVRVRVQLLDPLHLPYHKPGDRREIMRY